MQANPLRDTSKLVHPDSCCSGEQAQCAAGQACETANGYGHSADCPNARCHVVIVGGGTAGWMTAATLRRRLGCQITLVESSSAPSIGVGEATIPAMLDWISNMGIDEATFLRETCGTYKLAIRFDNWVQRNHRYWHPFGACGGSIDGLDLIHFFERGVSQGWLSEEGQYTDFSFHRELCESAKSPRSIGPSGLEARPVENYAFHLDAGRLADFIRSMAIGDGVNHAVDHVTDVTLDDRQNITSVLLESGNRLAADLFIDCSGYASVLIERQLGAEWIDWSEQLLCDRAVTTRFQPASDSRQSINPYTVSTGMDAGWAWQIPLRTVTGAGYVYSSQHLGDEDARQELIRHLELPDDTECRSISMRVGYRRESWRANCIAIGLSSGFVEPLESTGIFSIQRSLDEFVECLPTSLDGNPNAALFNDRLEAMYAEIRDFVLMHYVVSRRDDTSFWRQARSVKLPDSLRDLIQRYRDEGVVNLPEHLPVFATANHHFILSGARISPGRTAYRSIVGQYDSIDLQRLFHRVRQQNQEVAAQMPDHAGCLDAVYFHHKSYGSSHGSHGNKGMDCVV